MDVFQQNKTLVFFYHSISNKNSRLSVDPDIFEKQIKHLQKENFKSISPFDLSESRNLKGKNIMICFDDGFKDNLSVAQPILEKYGFMATVFVATKFIGAKSEYGIDDKDRDNEMMNRDELKSLEQKGWIIANHFHSHRNLIDLSNEEIVEELNTSRDILEDIVTNKKSVDIVSYPRNKINKKVLDLMEEEGVDLAFAGDRELVNTKSNKLALPRIEIDRDVSFDKFRLYLSPSYFFIRNKIFKR